MFSRNSAPPSAPQPSGAKKSANGPSIIGPDLKIAGNLITEGDVQCDGTVDGDIHSRSLTVGESAVVNGSITGEIVRVAGVVNGEINARVVELTRTARVSGDVIHATLSIEAGAFIDGLCRHVDPKKAVEIGLATSPAEPRAVESRPAETAKPSLVVTSEVTLSQNAAGQGPASPAKMGL